MKLISKPVYLFTPKFNDNESLPVDERVSVEIIRPKAEERTELFSMDVERDVSTSEAGKPVAKAAVTFKRRYDVPRILRGHIGKINNLEEIREDGSIIPTRDGAALAESTMFGIGSLIDELCLEVISDIVTDTEKKISREPLK